MSIKLKLIALMLFIGLVPTLTVGIIAYLTLSNGINNNTASQLASTAIKQEQQISGILQKNQEELVKLANKYDFQVALTQYLSTKSIVDRDKIETVFRAKKAEISEIQNIFVTDNDDNVIASTLNGSVGTKIDSSGPDVTIKEDPSDQFKKLYISTKVTVNKTQSGNLIAVFRLDNIVAVVQDYTGLGKTGETMVVQEDSNKNAISLFPLRYDTEAALKTNINMMKPLTVDGKAYSKDSDYRKTPTRVVFVARAAATAGWTVVTKIDADEAEAPIIDLRNALLGIGLLSSVLITVVAIYLSRLFTDPIVEIAKVARMIGAGDFAAHLAMKRRDEFGALAENVNSMGNNLKDFVTSIESQRNRLEIILNSTEESILALDKQGNIMIANKATTSFTGLTMGDVVGKPIIALFVWMRDGAPYDIDYNAPGTQSYLDLQFTDHGGNLHYAEMVVSHVDDEHGESQTIVTIHDQTKSRELENMKLDFVSMAAHELRTPLATIRGYLDLVAMHGDMEASQKKERGEEIDEGSADALGYVKKALKSSTDLGGLITNLLDVTKIERNSLNLNMEKVDLAATVAESVKDVSMSAQAKDQTMTYQGPEVDKFVMADPIPLHEVINNLLSNAVKYTRPGGKIEVAMFEEETTYSVAIRDNGIGIPEKALPNLFTKFYRVDSGLDSKSGGGTGLGLFLTKSIIERHGGKIGVESKEGEGSTFTFSIPKFNEAEFAKHKDASSAKTESTRRKHGWSTKNTDR